MLAAVTLTASTSHENAPRSGQTGAILNTSDSDVVSDKIVFIHKWTNLNNLGD